jgi:asparagine synthetase A
MPNWCSNEVQFDGSEEDIAKFKEECFSDHKGEAVLDFSKVLPEPDYDKPKKDGTHNDGVQTELHSVMPDWWNWRNDNWGTKWNLVPTHDGDLTAYTTIEDSEDFIQLEFDTAWSPPNGIYEAIVDKYPDISVNWFYREDGVQMAGWLPYD